MLRKLLICPWFGEPPRWWPQYDENRLRLRAEGYDLALFRDLPAFKNRVKALLGVECPIVPGYGKIHDYRPAFGLLFAEELRGYDYWGHTDFDCFYGNVTRFMPDERLADLDVYSDHSHYICGPWTFYRNNRTIADTFKDNPEWRDRLEDPVASGWVETGFTSTVNDAGLRVLYELNHGYEAPERLTSDGDRLYEDGHEISFFHFRHTKAWPTVRLEEPCLA